MLDAPNLRQIAGVSVPDFQRAVLAAGDGGVPPTPAQRQRRDRLRVCEAGAKGDAVRKRKKEEDYLLCTDSIFTFPKDGAQLPAPYRLRVQVQPAPPLRTSHDPEASPSGAGRSATAGLHHGPAHGSLHFQRDSGPLRERLREPQRGA